MNIPIGTSGRTALEVARDAAKLAGTFARERFDQEKDITFKRPGDIVTEVDIQAEALIFGLIRQEFPDHTLVGEESAADVRADSGYAWIVDPVDGTRNYAGGLPIYSTVVGLALDGEVLVGVNYDPERDDLFEAERGAGAYLNGKRIHVSKKAALKDCIIGFDLPYSDVGARYELDMLAQAVWPNMGTVRTIGSSALASHTLLRAELTCISSTAFRLGTRWQESFWSKRRAESSPTGTASAPPSTATASSRRTHAFTPSSFA